MSASFPVCASMSHRILLAVSLSLLSMGAACAADFDYTVQIDASGEIAGLLGAHLDIINQRDDPDMGPELLDALIEETPDEARALLETQGYFNAQVRVERISNDPVPQLVIHVQPGPSTLVQDVTVRLDGPIRDDGDYQARLAAVLEAWPLPLGAPFRQDEWDSGKRAVRRLLTVDRYPLAKISESRVDVDPARNAAEITLVADSGPLVSFGSIQVEGTQRYPRKIVEGQADFRPGDPYTLQKVLDYQSALEQTQHFSSAVVNTDMARLDEAMRVPVDVKVTEFPKQKLELGLNYGSEEGFGTRLAYDHYNVFRRGYIGSALIDWNRDEQTLSLGLGIPRNRNGYSHIINTTYKNSEVQNVRTETLEAGLWRIRKRDSIEARFGVDYVMERETIVNQPSTDTKALIPGVGWTRREIDDHMRPRNGYLIDAQVSGTLGGALSNTTFVRGYGKGAIYWSPYPKYGTFVGRLELGQVWARDTDAVPESRLFRTGGASSIRGHEYQSLGVPGPDGAVLGGRVLAVASVEYQIPVARDWAVALFTDVGDAAYSWKTFDLNTGVGIGARWMSPVAPFAFDIARGSKDGKLRWNIGLGLAF